MELCGENCRPEDEKHIPQSFLIHKRLTGWNTTVREGEIQFLSLKIVCVPDMFHSCHMNVVRLVLLFL